MRKKNKKQGVVGERGGGGGGLRLVAKLKGHNTRRVDATLNDLRGPLGAAPNWNDQS